MVGRVYPFFLICCLVMFLIHIIQIVLKSGVYSFHNFNFSFISFFIFLFCFVFLFPTKVQETASCLAC